MSEVEIKKEIGQHYYTVINGPKPCTWTCRVLCFLGLHRWSWPGGWCECCGKDDDLQCPPDYGGEGL